MSEVKKQVTVFLTSNAFSLSYPQRNRQPSFERKALFYGTRLLDIRDTYIDRLCYVIAFFFLFIFFNSKFLGISNFQKKLDKDNK